VNKLYTKVQNAIAAREMDADEEGAAMVEYGLLVAFIALVALVGVKALGVKLDTLFGGISF
jgi:Flp pilus assembly pilin Flp